MKKFFILFGFLLMGMTITAQTTQQADSLHQRGREFVNEGKIAEGRECTRQAMEIRKKLLGEVSEDYITSLNNYALTFGMEKEYAKAIELQEQVMALVTRGQVHVRQTTPQNNREEMNQYISQDTFKNNDDNK